MAKDNYYNKKHYKTEKGIETFHNVKYEMLDTQIEFENALLELDDQKYVSIIAERARTAYYKKTLKIFGTKDKKLASFEKLCNSFLISISPDLNLELIENNIFQKAHNNIHKFVYVPGKKFVSTWIHKDVIYRDEFTFLNEDKATSKVLIMKSMKTPFELSRTSLASTTIRLHFRKGWKDFIKEIEREINK